MNRKRLIRIAISCFLLSSISFWVLISFIKKEVWSISIYSGTNPYEFTPNPSAFKNPAVTADDVTDVPASFVADPFMIQENHKWYMFFEVFNSSTRQGDIGLASSIDGVNYQYEEIVLDEPFHLSYPYVFKWNNSYYMIPESRRGSAVKLYKATEFPSKWLFVTDLIIGDYADPSIMYKDDKWWLFLFEGDGSLELWYSNNLTGSWIEHPDSPLVKDNRNISRPGGRIIITEDKIIRYVQDCEPEYGNAVRVFQVDDISTTNYKDHEITKESNPMLFASGVGWNSEGMHHIDPHQLNDTNWIACVDGKYVEVVFDLKLGAIRFFDKMKQWID